MGSSYFGEPNLAKEGSTSSSSPKKEKKSNNKNKPKQPRRGLGVAQLEKIRLQTKLSHGTFYPYNLSQDVSMSNQLIIYKKNLLPMGLIRLQNEIIEYGNPQSTTISRWVPSNGMFESQQFTESSAQVEEAEKTRRKRNDLILPSSNQNSGTRDYQELDLELRLSI